MRGGGNRGFFVTSLLVEGKGGGYNPPICSVILLDDIPLTD